MRNSTASLGCSNVGHNFVGGTFRVATTRFAKNGVTSVWVAAMEPETIASRSNVGSDSVTQTANQERFLRLLDEEATGFCCFGAGVIRRKPLSRWVGWDPRPPWHCFSAGPRTLIRCAPPRVDGVRVVQPGQTQKSASFFSFQESAARVRR